MKVFLSQYGDQLPSLFKKLYEDLGDEYVMEYEFITPSLDETRSTLQSDAFDDDVHFFMRDPVGSRIGFWVTHEPDFTKCPIVTFDCDGDHAVIAPNFDRFLSQLYFGSAYRWQLMHYMSRVNFVEKRKARMKSDDEEIPSLEDHWIISESQLSEHLDELKADFGFHETHAWLVENGISQLENMVEVVRATFHEHPNFLEFVESKMPPKADFNLQYTVTFDKDKNMFQRKHFEQLDAMLRKDLEGFHLENVDFEECKLKNLDLSGIDLSHFNFRKAILKNINFSNCKLGKSSFVEARVTSCNFSGADIKMSDFHSIEVKDSDFSGANLSRCNLRWMTFLNCDLVGVTFTGSLLTSTDFTTSRMRGCTYGRVEFSAVDFPEGYHPNHDEPE